MRTLAQVDFSFHHRFEGESFADQDLRGMDLSHKTFINCNFDRADLRETTFEYSDLTCSSFVGSNCYRTNFKDANLTGIRFAPKDAYGATFTFTCKTFDGVKISQTWWYSWLLMATKMIPDSGPVKESLRDNLIACIGSERWVRLKAMFQNRNL